MDRKFTDTDNELLSELGVDIPVSKTTSASAKERRAVEGFREILLFIEREGREPRIRGNAGFLERRYATRLETIRSNPDLCELFKDIDYKGILIDASRPSVKDMEDLDDSTLLEELGVDVEFDALTNLKHVRASAERKAADEIAQRKICDDFADFKPLFEKVQQELNEGVRVTRPFEIKAEIEVGRFFILGGQKAYIAEMSDKTLTAQGRTDARLRVIFDNGTESGMLMRSLQRALNKDDAGRRITEANAGPLFTSEPSTGDVSVGYIYVLRSRSDLPFVAQNRQLIHKIGVTSVSVEQRVAGAQLQPTFLMAGVDIVATYKLYNVNQNKLEQLIHRIFQKAKLDIQIVDRFGKPVVPQEWFLVPIAVIDEAVESIISGAIQNFVYDPGSGRLVSAE